MPIQLHQSINLFLLLIIGSLFSSVHMAWEEIVAVLLFTVVVEHFFLYINKNREFYFSYSSLSTAIGVLLLMYASSLWIYFVLIALGLAQKHFLFLQQKNLKQKHLFNPSNFALMMGLTFFYDDAHIISGQFGDNFLFSMLVLVLALSILVRVNRWLISLVFLLSYLVLQYFLVLGFDPVMTFENIYHRFYSVTFMLFIYFMLTDPMVTPAKWYWQLGFGFLVALLATILDTFYGFRVQHLFMSVFFFSFIFNFISLEKKSISDIKRGVIILFFMLVLLGYIECQEPYYFEMNG